jgi:hypothetical protein
MKTASSSQALVLPIFQIFGKHFFEAPKNLQTNTHMHIKIPKTQHKFSKKREISDKKRVL